VAKLPDLTADPTLDAIDAALVERQEREDRPYYGMSTAGYECARRRWLQFRWAGREQLSSQSIKAIEDGHRGEALQAERLRMVPGLRLITDQYEVEALGHMKGHIDGAVLGLLQAPKSWHVWEHKQVNEKKQAALQKAKDQYGEKDAIEHWDPVFFVQAQLYMRYTGMERHYLTASTPGGRATISCRTAYQKDKAEKIEAEARSVISATEPPERISNDPSWFECKFCPFHAQCHGQALPRPTCRTCAHSTPTATGAWSCAVYDVDIDLETQRRSDHCPEHRYIPILIEKVAELQTADDDNKVRWLNKLTGKTFDQPGYDSREMYEAQDFRCIGDDFVETYKEVFGKEARVVAPPPEEGGDAPLSDLETFYEQGEPGGDAPGAEKRPGKARRNQRRVPVV
jgi:hypothetical protein